jgi:hypothetical protein
VKQVTKPSSCMRCVQYKYKTVDFTFVSLSYISQCPKLWLFYNHEICHIDAQFCKKLCACIVSVCTCTVHAHAHIPCFTEILHSTKTVHKAEIHKRKTGAA